MPAADGADQPRRKAGGMVVETHLRHMDERSGRDPAGPAPAPGPGPGPGPTTVYFDGACPVCSREIAHYRARPGAAAMRWVDATTCPAEALGPDLTRSAALGRMHVRTPDGRLVDGARAFAALWRGLPGFAWLGRVAGHPMVAPVAEAGYRLFLRVRRAWR